MPGASGDDGQGQDGRGVLGAGNDVPVGRLEDLDVSVERAGDDAAAVGGEGQSGDGLLVVGDQAERLGGYEVEDGDGGARGGEQGRAAGEREDFLDGVGVLEGQDRTARGAGVPDADGRVVRAGHQEVVAVRHEGSRTDVILVAREHAAGRVGGQVPQADRLVVGAGHERRQFGGRPLGYPDGLLVDVPGLENHGARARADVEDLHLAGIFTGHEHAPVRADLAAVSLRVEAADGLEQLALADGEDVDAGARGDGEEVVGLGGGDERVRRRGAVARPGKADVRDGPCCRRGVGFLVLEGLPVALLGRDGADDRGQLESRQRLHFGCHCGWWLWIWYMGGLREIGRDCSFKFADAVEVLCCSVIKIGSEWNSTRNRGWERLSGWLVVLFGGGDFAGIKVHEMLKSPSGNFFDDAIHGKALEPLEQLAKSR